MTYTKEQRQREQHILTTMARFNFNEPFALWDIIAHSSEHLNEDMGFLVETVHRTLKNIIGVRGRTLEENYTRGDHQYIWRKRNTTLWPEEQTLLDTEQSEGILFAHQHPQGQRCTMCTQPITEYTNDPKLYWKRQEVSEEGEFGEALFFHNGLCLEQYYWKENQKKREKRV